MPASAAGTVVPPESSWPASSVDKLADALFGPDKDWQKANAIIERAMDRPDARTQFVIMFFARHLPAIVDLHCSGFSRLQGDALFPPGRFHYLSSVVSTAMMTEYFAKFIRDSPASVGPGLMLDELHFIERSLRGDLGFLRAEASQHPLPVRAHEALTALSEKAYRLLFIWIHIPSEARTALFFAQRRYPTLVSVVAAFMDSKERTQKELLALQEDLAPGGRRWTRGMVEFSFLDCLAVGNCAPLAHLSEVIKRQAHWSSCEAKRDESLGPCRNVPEEEEMMACGRCGTVRYCCKDHQRADWKQHKPRCFPVTWDVRPPPPPTSGGLDELD